MVDISSGYAIWNIKMVANSGADEASVDSQVNAYITRSRMGWVSSKSEITLTILTGKKEARP